MTTLVTAIYNNLHGTSYGGRQSREIHYTHSLKTLMNIPNVKLIIYTNDYVNINTYLKNNIDNKNIEYSIIEKSLDSLPNKDKLDKLKNLEAIKTSTRCFELQYLKILWLLDNLPNNDDDSIYWIDAGLSYSGLIPDKYLNINGNTYYDKYFNCSLFNEKFIQNLIRFTDNKFFVIAKENVNFFWDQTIPEKFYTTYCRDRHIIGGLFGGKKQIVKIVCNKFIELLNVLLTECSILYSEEQVLSALYYNNPEYFQSKFFDLWWHEDNIKSLFNGKEQEILKDNKSFYKILEELNN